MYDKIVSKLDGIAENLESKGLLKEASDLDVVANTLEKIAAEDGTEPVAEPAGAPATGLSRGDSNPVVGINTFVMRQTKPDFAGTKVTKQQIDRMRQDVERMATTKQLKPGYAPFVKIARVKSPDVICPIAKITPENKHLLKTRMTKRRDFEEEYEQRYFESKDVKGIPSDHVDVILYSREQLASEPDGTPTGADWDIISINAEPTPEATPMAPETMKRNMKGPESGGSGHQHSPEELSKSESFWSNHAMIM